jgi:hypothetical protein
MDNSTKTMDLPLALRTRNALEKHNLRDWGAVKAADLTQVPGLGSKGLDAIQALLEDEAALEQPFSVESLLDRETETPEESIAKGQRRDQVTQKIDTAMRQRLDDTADYDRSMRGGLESLGKAKKGFELDGWEVAKRAPRWPDGRMVDPIEEIKARTVDFRVLGGSVEPSDGRGLLVLRLEADIQARISALIPTIKGLPHVKELGVEVSAETVGRMALIRGLDMLEKAHGGAKTAAKTPENGENRAPAPENADAPLPTGDEEVYDTPEGWSRVGLGEAIPVPEAVLHDYYSQNGWNRYWGKANDQVIYFYWAPERRLQDLKPFPGTDKSGRAVAIQETPWGPGHVVPHKWANS